MAAGMMTYYPVIKGVTEFVVVTVSTITIVAPVIASTATDMT
jgi:hypothetical protein